MLGKVLIALLVIAGGFVLYQLLKKGGTAMAAPATNGQWPSNFGSTISAAANDAYRAKYGRTPRGAAQETIAAELAANTGAGHF